MRCLFCGKALLFRRGAGGRQFCGATHRDQYDQMVVARLVGPDRDPARSMPAETPAPPPAIDTPPVIDSPPEAAEFRVEAARPAGTELGRKAVLEMRCWEPAAPRRISSGEYRRAACLPAAATPISLRPRDASPSGIAAPREFLRAAHVAAPPLGA